MAESIGISNEAVNFEPKEHYTYNYQVHDKWAAKSKEQKDCD